MIAALLQLSCVAAIGGWDLAALEAAHPELAAKRGHRLGDAPPYWMPNPSRDSLLLFLCRWSLDAPLRVSFPPDATAVEADVLRLALSAWEEALPGLHFERANSGDIDIELRFLPVPEEPVIVGVGDTVADCAFEEGGATAEPLRAELAFASIELNRVLYDVAGRPWVLEPEELLGGTLHELGHALGYPGHARARDSIMNTVPGEVRRLARRVLRGEGFESPTLEALYVLPSGQRLGQVALPMGRLGVFDAMRTRAGDLRGPFVRVGDANSRMIWRRVDGRAAGSLVLGQWRRVLDDADRFELVPTPLAQAVLSRPPSRR